MKAVKVEILILDFDGLGEDEIISVIENTRYPNHCISPDVKSIESVEIEWDDNHPLNMKSTCDDAYNELFGNA
jgi:hypothetical protein